MPAFHPHAVCTMRIALYVLQLRIQCPVPNAVKRDEQEGGREAAAAASVDAAGGDKMARDQAREERHRVGTPGWQQAATQMVV